jgi:hypothetical protein
VDEPAITWFLDGYAALKSRICFDPSFSFGLAQNPQALKLGQALDTLLERLVLAAKHGLGSSAWERYGSQRPGAEAR